MSALIGTALIGTALLGTLMIASGCQGPGAGEGLRLPGTPNLPGFHQVPTPKLTPGGKTPKVPGVTSVTPTEQHINPLPEAASAEIAQVGFVDRMRNRMAGNCGSCQGCTQGDSCGQCEMVLPNYSVVPLGRPVDPQEFLCNGGDIPPEARVLQNDQVGALEPQDAIVHYTTESGDINLQASNRVCLYSPRFGSVRQVSGAVAGEKAIGLQRTFLPVGPTGVGLTQPSLAVSDIDELAHADVAKRVDGMRDRNRGVPVEGIVQPQIAIDALQILGTLDFVSLGGMSDAQLAILKKGHVAARSWMVRDAVEAMVEGMKPPTLTRDARVEAFVEYDFPDAGRLQIMKVADKDHAQQGEVVTFAIHVRNVGDSPVHQVEIADSLVTRLEYVEDSQSCDRAAEFETMGNAAGSVRMKWSLSEPLAVGESAKIEFKCRVR